LRWRRAQGLAVFAVFVVPKTAKTYGAMYKINTGKFLRRNVARLGDPTFLVFKRSVGTDGVRE
jgi:hypothetical protein